MNGSSERPTDLERLTTFPDAMTRITAFNLMVRLRGYRSLDDFDRHTQLRTEKPMNGANYGWYQLRIEVLAGEIFDEGGEAALTRLWAFGQREAARRTSAGAYAREHSGLPPIDWPGWMSARELASLLGSEVSPRLGHAIASWR